MSEWRPIDTAPKDPGKEIMAGKFGLHLDGKTTVCERDPFVSFWSPTLGKFYASPTHWLCELPPKMPMIETEQ